jgi:hypothetical protein
LTSESCDSINNKWDKISHGIHNVDSEVLGNITVEHHNDWYDEECQIATEKMNKSYAIMQCFSTFLSPRTSKMSEKILRTTKLRTPIFLNLCCITNIWDILCHL